jgi:2-polyprenyl-6-methoxyphenol hydroxylase-like FAD-dependent oxidoreductase
MVWPSQVVRFEAIEWQPDFRLHHRGVSHYRVGHVFLAGDAAHVHSPIGTDAGHVVCSTKSPGVHYWHQ